MTLLVKWQHKFFQISAEVVITWAEPFEKERQIKGKKIPF